MFGHTFKHLFSFLLLLSAASCAALPRELSLEPRQGGCLSALPRPNPVNNVGRISFQAAIDARERRTWWPNNLIDVHIEVPENVESTNHVTVEITNRSWSANAIVLTNFQDTRSTTQPRQQVRVTVPAQTRQAGAVIAGTRIECVRLPRLDGTWYFQVEQ
ncbi:hypothetical protein B0J12DRAFT_610372 [Macrophomina phaseolina]|uniref:Uncharacterized protein n=1 Tax=Macrophomina phaseolina TaxID=35725 RepID=A0ABQ8FT04_9PEZI|nr:hypothetical protein B0J12DRAFT_610372 [Macrophomina phaseolina]